MRIGIVGAGAVGGVLGGLLARAGHDVGFVAHGESLDALRSRGLTVEAPGETFTTGPLFASTAPAELGQRELVIVAVKAWQVESLAPELVGALGPGAVLVPVQNGVEAADHLSRALGQGRVVGGICRVLATREAPGRVRYVGLPPELLVGESKGGPSPRLEKIAGALRDAGIVAAVSPDIREALWSKLLFVEPLGSVGAVTRASVDVVRSIPETRALLEQAMREVQAVAMGNGTRLPDDAVPRALARVDGMPAGATASMHRDLVEARPSELNEQTGAVVRLGRQVGVPRPVHDVLFASLLPQDRRLFPR